MLARRVRVLMDAQASRGERFLYYNSEKPLAERFAENEPAAVADVETGEFFARLRRNEDAHDDYLYYNGLLALLGPEMVKDVDVDAVLRCPMDDEPTVNAWIGGANVTASMHYDSFHNVYVQLFGSKRFVLYPPSHEHTLFPKLHPSYRQVQRVPEVDGDAAGDSAALDAMGRIVITLRAGEALYLPPFWFHHVTAVDTSISINAWCLSREFKVMDDAVLLPIPMESEWDEATLHDAVRIYATMIVELGPMPRIDFVRRVLYSRYEPLGDVGAPHAHCTSRDSEREARLRAHMARGIDALAPLFDAIDDDVVREWHMANYIEELVSLVVGADRTQAFIRDCLLDNAQHHVHDSL